MDTKLREYKIKGGVDFAERISQWEMGLKKAWLTCGDLAAIWGTLDSFYFRE